MLVKVYPLLLNFRSERAGVALTLLFGEIALEHYLQFSTPHHIPIQFLGCKYDQQSMVLTKI